MPKAVKGCINPECNAYKNKRHFKNTDDFCPQCGQPLCFVCKRCGMKLENDTRKYCVRCENEMKDKRDRLGETIVETIVSGAKATGRLASGVGQKAVKLAENAATGIKESAERVRTSKEEKQLILPEEYKRLNRKIPDLGFQAKQKEIYGFKTGYCRAIIIQCIVDDSVAMPFDNIQSIVDDWHNDMPDNAGLIDVCSCNTNRGRPIVYFIMKHSLSEDLPNGNEYTLNANIKYDDRIFFINASYAEEGTTGLRDSIVYELFRREHPDLKDPLEGWSSDPFDSEYEKGYLMNQSEKQEYDRLFPDHPLSKARELISFLLENN